MLIFSARKFWSLKLKIEISTIKLHYLFINSVKSEFSNIPTIPSENTGGIPALMLIKDLDLEIYKI